jgi:hypothetical protein
MTDTATGVTHVNQVCASIMTATYSDETGEFVGNPSFYQGCRVDLPTGALKVDAKLNWATLAATTVTLEDQGCEKTGCEPGTARDVVLVATWTGFGPLDSSKYHGSSNGGGCRSHETFKGSARAAEVTGSLGGEPLAGDRFGYLSMGKHTFRSSCTEV